MSMLRLHGVRRGRPCQRLQTWILNGALIPGGLWDLTSPFKLAHSSLEVITGAKSILDEKEQPLYRKGMKIIGLVGRGGMGRAILTGAR